MVRKGNQYKNGLDCKTANRRQIVSDPIDASFSEEKQNFEVQSPNTVDRDLSVGGEKRIKETNYMGGGKRNKQRLGHPKLAQMDDIISNGRDTDINDILHRNNSPSLFMSEGLSMATISGHIRSSAALSGKRVRLMALDLWNLASGWFEQKKPWFSTYKARVCNVYDYVLVRTKDIYPIIWTWIMHIGQLILFLFVIWVDCNIRGINSILHLGTSSFFTVVWCSILSVIAMVGYMKALIVMVISALVALFAGFALGALILAILSTISLWLYGSFWITSLIVFIGGSTFALSHERVALLVTTVYSMYCAKSYVGLLGLLLGLNLSFLSSDILTYFLKNKIEQESRHFQEQDRQTPSEPSNSSFVDDASASRRSDVPSTSGCEEELTSEGEVVRLLNCSDHYSALGFARFENIDISLLKREYRKKAMLVHPDKNMGNEKAAEAFKKLQNAYEVLLDSLKRKTYDDELRREELLNYFRRFQSASQKKGKHNIFNSESSLFDAEDEGSHGESRRIACKKCGDFHKWICTERSKLRARWCQDCNDFHPAKDGDGWLEQSLHPFLFGLLQKADAPCAYVCADSRIYNATEWFICQGMRCPANTHKPSFHVNTSLSSKHSTSAGKGASSSHRGSGGGMPNSTNIDEPMTEEEFFEWLQNAMQSGGFEASGANESPSAKSASSSKGSGSVKKKKKGKKQW